VYILCPKNKTGWDLRAMLGLFEKITEHQETPPFLGKLKNQSLQNQAV
jgi:hypothetical protein